MLAGFVIPGITSGESPGGPEKILAELAKGTDPLRVIFDTDIQGDVDDVGAVALLHALANRNEIEILAMGVSAKHPATVPCLEALNTFFGHPEIPIGWNHREGFLRDSRYADAIAAHYPHQTNNAAEAPVAADLYRRALARAPARSVVMISVGQLSNFEQLLETGPDDLSPRSGVDLVKEKVALWVCMGGKFPRGREANLIHHGTASKAAIEQWPTPILFSGFEIGREVLTGGRLIELPPSNPVRRAYKRYNGIQPHKSWDQTAVLAAVRGVAPWWDTQRGTIEIDPSGENRWRATPEGENAILVEKMPPEKVADLIESLMLEGARAKGGTMPRSPL